MRWSAVTVVLSVFALTGQLPVGTAGQAVGTFGAVGVVGVVGLAALTRTVQRALAVQRASATRPGAAASPVRVRGLALRRRAHRLAFLRARDPGAAGRPRPRAPGVTVAAA